MGSRTLIYNRSQKTGHIPISNHGQSLRSTIDGESTILKRIYKDSSMCTSAIEIAYSKWIRGWKEIAHIFEIQGRAQLSNKISIFLEGSYLQFSFARKIAKSLSLSSDSTFMEVSKAMAFAAECSGAESALNRWKSGKLLILITGCSVHSVTIVFFRNIFIVCDLCEWINGDKKYAKSYRIRSFDKKLLDQKLIEKIINMKDKTLDDYRYLMKEIAVQLQFKIKKNVFEQKLESMQYPIQKIANCTWVCLDASVQASFVLINLSKRHCSLTDSVIDEVMHESGESFQQWQKMHKERRLVKQHQTFKKMHYQFKSQWKLCNKSVKQIHQIWEKHGLKKLWIPTIEN